MPDFSKISIIMLFTLVMALSACSKNSSDEGRYTSHKIDRQALVSRHNPQLTHLDYSSPFTVGNGQFAFTADITGLQSLAADYFTQGIPLETKARWAWHSRVNPNNYQLDDANQHYQAYGRDADFPTNADTAAGQWLRQNPHDLPLARIALQYQGKPLQIEQLSAIEQRLDLWNGQLNSHYQLEGNKVDVMTIADAKTDSVAFTINSRLVAQGQLSIKLAFPRGYDLNVKNTPDLLWNEDSAHVTTIQYQDQHSAVLLRQVDDAQHWLKLSWQGQASLMQDQAHQYSLKIANSETDTQAFSLSVQFNPSDRDLVEQNTFAQISESAQKGWQDFWQSGAAIDFSGSTSVQAHELERRIILSQYLMAVQERAAIPAQETGLTSSSWYGKFHSEMSWWHSAHWALWGRSQYTETLLDWYVSHLDVARDTAKQRGLQGARWSKMLGPDGRESPGGNPLIIWNQPQPIDLAELVYQSKPEPQTLAKYAQLVDETAQALSSMLVWEEDQQRYSLLPPIWIAQEHYAVTESKNPSFELAYWRTALQTAQIWRQRLGQAPHPLWQQQIDQLAELPQKDGKYVAIETIPDTFDNIESRNDHPAMLAPWGLLQEQRVDRQTMLNTLDAVMNTWDFAERIWGWDYPMIAMTANMLNRPQIAIDALLMDAHNNHYLTNGHCPQFKVGLPVYLPANGALLAAVARMATTNVNLATLGFPANTEWQVKAEGFLPQ
ncbi:hypothetical protein [Paraglaciecola hydrolytica]|uniref:Glycoside hydrolase family 65 n=1 Tax=Paraglaciecola hydrolytica TaxID=1799789 RepID=A0A135ZYQ0_9ALTE|nr:hypothetical protein [Paraglaciecola hydrolytica]KXI28097.1 hypothetical protein AX660_17065 [Paraglaciecola hydrolytica]